MAKHLLLRVALLCVALILTVTPARAQVVESVGTRALGMGGAFVAVAADSSATWWNPAGLAAGPFLDLGIGKTDDASWFALATPPFGLSYYHLQITDAQAFNATTGQVGGNRE